MANDVIHILAHFGFGEGDRSVDVLAHDRGARVAHRLALDYPDRVRRMCLLDIAPTLYMYENTDMAFVSGRGEVRRVQRGFRRGGDHHGRGEKRERPDRHGVQVSPSARRILHLRST
jgi:pimeloyl-ACP methyl ester carboxylesterase